VVLHDELSLHLFGTHHHQYMKVSYVQSYSALCCIAARHQ